MKNWLLYFFNTKILKMILFILIIQLKVYGQTTTTINKVEEVTTIGKFDGEIVNKYGYKINDYWIALNDLTMMQVDSFRGKRIIVKGIIKIVNPDSDNHIQSTNDTKIYIDHPTISIYRKKKG